jgi:manganese transport protein
MLVISQVELSMQLSFAIFPLVAFTSNKAIMGEFANKRWVMWTGYAVCTLIGGLNAFMLYKVFKDQVINGPMWLGLIVLTGVGFAVWVMYFYKPKAAAVL